MKMSAILKCFPPKVRRRSLLLIAAGSLTTQTASCTKPIHSIKDKEHQTSSATTQPLAHLKPLAEPGNYVFVAEPVLGALTLVVCPGVPSHLFELLAHKGRSALSDVAEALSRTKKEPRRKDEFGCVFEVSSAVVDLDTALNKLNLSEEKYRPLRTSIWRWAKTSLPNFALGNAGKSIMSHAAASTGSGVFNAILHGHPAQAIMTFADAPVEQKLAFSAASLLVAGSGMISIHNSKRTSEYVMSAARSLAWLRASSAFSAAIDKTIAALTERTDDDGAKPTWAPEEVDTISSEVLEKADPSQFMPIFAKHLTFEMHAAGLGVEWARQALADFADRTLTAQSTGP